MNEANSKFFGPRPESTDSPAGSAEGAYILYQSPLQVADGVYPLVSASDFDAK